MMQRQLLLLRQYHKQVLCISFYTTTTTSSIYTEILTKKKSIYTETNSEKKKKKQRRGRKMSSSSSSPSRSHASNSSNSSKEERPRFFDAKAKNLCWSKAEVVSGRHPERWRRDAAGNIVCKRFCNCQGCLCFEYDHTIPFSKGGESVAENCQILQTRVNRYKSDKEVDKTELQGFSCDVKFTDKELDIIEMAVYGDVIRPGNECRCRTVAEMLGQYKSKHRAMAACQLPYDKEAS